MSTHTNQQQTQGYVQGNVFVELGLQNLSDERKVKLLDQMNELIHKRTLMRIVDTLPPEVSDQLQKMAENASEEEQMKEIMKYVPNLADIILEEVQQVKNEMKATAAEVDEQGV